MVVQILDGYPLNYSTAKCEKCSRTYAVKDMIKKVYDEKDKKDRFIGQTCKWLCPNCHYIIYVYRCG